MLLRGTQRLFATDLSFLTHFFQIMMALIVVATHIAVNKISQLEKKQFP